MVFAEEYFAFPPYGQNVVPAQIRDNGMFCEPKDIVLRAIRMEKLAARVVAIWI